MSPAGLPSERTMALSLLDDAPPASRCPCLFVEGGWPACRAATGGPDGRRLAANVLSLQLWCLGGPGRWAACMHWPHRPAGGEAAGGEAEGGAA